MSANQRCAHCGANCPAAARFCIECGKPIVAAATGATTRLPKLNCPACQTVNEAGGRFCVRCGADLFARPQPRPAPRIYPRVSAPPAARRANAAPATDKAWVGALIILVGVFILFAYQSLWPGILFVVGVGTFINDSNAGHAERGLKRFLWLGGLALLLATGTFWPGIIVLIIISRYLS